MSGDGNKNGTIQYIKDRELKENVDELIVVTSGAGEIFKDGIPIGKVLKNSVINNEVVIDFYIDFSQLKYVRVVSFKKEKNFLDLSSKKGAEKVSEQIEVLEKQKETLRILLEQKKISDEIRVKIEEKSDILKRKVIKLEKQLYEVKEQLNNTELKNEETKFKEFNILYKTKCKKTFYNKLYKVGTPEYKNCILNKGKKN